MRSPTLPQLSSRPPALPPKSLTHPRQEQLALRANIRMGYSKLMSTVALAAVAMVAPFAHAASPVNVVELTAAQIESDLSGGLYSTHDLVQSYLDRINTYNPNYNAFTYLNPADALAQADAIDAQIHANGVTKPLQGVPIVIKDSMNVAGLRTTSGFFWVAPRSRKS